MIFAWFLCVDSALGRYFLFSVLRSTFVKVFASISMWSRVLSAFAA